MKYRFPFSWQFTIKLPVKCMMERKFREDVFVCVRLGVSAVWVCPLRIQPVPWSPALNHGTGTRKNGDQVSNMRLVNFAIRQFWEPAPLFRLLGRGPRGLRSFSVLDPACLIYSKCIHWFQEPFTGVG
jgi:hypothetical protein